MDDSKGRFRCVQPLKHNFFSGFFANGTFLASLELFSEHNVSIIPDDGRIFHYFGSQQMKSHLFCLNSEAKHKSRSFLVPHPPM